MDNFTRKMITESRIQRRLLFEQDSSETQQLSTSDANYTQLVSDLNQLLTESIIEIKVFRFNRTQKKVEVIGTIQSSINFIMVFHNTESGIYINNTDSPIKLNNDIIDTFQKLNNYYESSFKETAKNIIENS